MAFAINQNFDLKSKRKDFVRQELTLADLKTTREADYPDDYTVTIGGKIYIFNSSNSVDPILGKWREFAGGGGGSITPGSGLEATGNGTLFIKIGSGFTFDDNSNLCLDCSKDETVGSEQLLPIKIGSMNSLGIVLGSALQKEPGDKLNIKVNSNSVLEVTDQGLEVRVGSGLRNDQGLLKLGICGVYKMQNGTLTLSTADGIIEGKDGVLNFKLATGLDVDDNGCLYVSEAASETSVAISTGLARDSEGRLYVDVDAIINA